MEEPKIALLNIGSEAMKGSGLLQEAYELIGNTAHLPGKFVGFIEGDSMYSGGVDVVVTDGFTGNISLKTMEGTARMITSRIKKAFKHSWFMKIGMILCLPGILVMLPTLLLLKKQIDPRHYNGASRLGLRGLCIKSHGGTDALGFSNAISVAAKLAVNRFIEVVEKDLNEIGMDKEAEATAS